MAIYQIASNMNKQLSHMYVSTVKFALVDFKIASNNAREKPCTCKHCKNALASHKPVIVI